MRGRWQPITIIVPPKASPGERLSSMREVRGANHRHRFKDIHRAMSLVAPCGMTGSSDPHLSCGFFKARLNGQP